MVSETERETQRERLREGERDRGGEREMLNGQQRFNYFNHLMFNCFYAEERRMSLFPYPGQQ